MTSMKTPLLLLLLNFYLVPVLLTQPSEIFITHRKRNSNLGLSPPSTERKFLQKLDHFNPVDNQEWHQRYWIHSSPYKDGGPAFLFVNGEGTASPNFNDSEGEYWKSYANELNAFCFVLEHRFYGESWPQNGNMFRHLSSEQAIADIANFIQGATEEFKFPKGIKWIVFGCSYAGSLAAWARLKYPHLVFGAVASGAPLLAKADFSECQEVMEQSLSSYHPKCLENIALGIQEIVSLETTKDGWKKILKAFDFNKDKDKETEFLPRVFAKIHGVLIDVPKVCDQMVNATGKKNKYKYLANLINSEESGGSYTSAIDELNDQSWWYQACSEFGFFLSIGETSSLFAGIFPISAEMLTKDICKPYFGPDYLFSVNDINERVLQTNILYGGLNFNVNRTLFVHGSYDPWHALGLHKEKKDSMYQTVFMNASSHCSEVYYSTKDIPEVADARKKILGILKVWLQKNS